LGKTKHGGVRFSNLTGIKTSSIPVIVERDCDISHLKIGLLNVRSLTSKVVTVNEVIADHNLDVIGLTETWLKPDEFTVLNEASPFTTKKMTAFSSFELLVTTSMQPTQPLFIATVFLTEFPEFLSDFVVIAANIHIFGDFNIDMEKSTDPH
jgi:hypothetical protein